MSNDAHSTLSATCPDPIPDVSPIPKVGRTRFVKMVESFVSRGPSPLVDSKDSRNLRDECSLSNTMPPPAPLIREESVLAPLNAQSTHSNLSESGYYGSWHRSKPNENYGVSLAASMNASELRESQLQGTSTPRSRITSSTKIGRQLLQESISEEDTSACVTTNPFESHLLGNVTSHTFSPSVFHKVVSPNSQETPPANAEFRWSIDHMAVLQPVDIDEFPVHQPDPHEVHPDIEARIQSGLDSFWSQAHVAPSPVLSTNACSNPVISRLVKSGPLGSATSSTTSSNTRRYVKIRAPVAREVSSQTMLTFPPDRDIMKLLGDYFKYNEDTCSPSVTCEEAANLSLNSLRRKLFRGEGESNSANVSLNESGASKMDVSTCHFEEHTRFDDECDLVGVSTSRCWDDSTPPIDSPNISPIHSEGEDENGL